MYHLESVFVLVYRRLYCGKRSHATKCHIVLSINGLHIIYVLNKKIEERAMNKLLSVSTGLLLLAGNAMAAHEPRDETAGEAPEYMVVCADGAVNAKQCEVDKATYIGWRTYATNCQVCHGGSGLGSTFAPNLMDRFNKEGVDYARFKYVISEGYSGNVGAMPAWKKNKGVMKGLDSLYIYLQARADEKLPQGRPKRIK